MALWLNSLLLGIMIIVHRLSAKLRRSTRREKSPTLDLKPTLPTELLEKIIRHCIGAGASRRVELEGPFEDTPYDPTITSDPGLPADIRSLRRVSYRFSRLVEGITVEHLVIGSQGDLNHYILAVKRNQYTPGRKTRRVDFTIRGHYHPSDVATLLSLTSSNTTCLTFNNHGTGAEIPNEVIAAICECSGVRRLEFNSKTEAPLFPSIVEISHRLVRLETLRLSHLHRPPLVHSLSRPRAVFRSLKTLSFDRPRSPSLPLIEHPDNSFLGCCFLLNYLSESDEQLPLLKRLELSRCPPLSTPFFVKHGHKIQTLKMATETIGTDLYKIFTLCTKLQTLLLDYDGAPPLQLPDGGQNLERIAITLTGSLCAFRLDWVETLYTEIMASEAPLTEVMIWDLAGLLHETEHRHLLARCGGSLLRWGISLVDDRRVSYALNGSRSTFDFHSLGGDMSDWGAEGNAPDCSDG